MDPKKDFRPSYLYCHINFPLSFQLILCASHHSTYTPKKQTYFTSQVFLSSATLFPSLQALPSLHQLRQVTVPSLLDYLSRTTCRYIPLSYRAVTECAVRTTVSYYGIRISYSTVQPTGYCTDVYYPLPPLHYCITSVPYCRYLLPPCSALRYFCCIATVGMGSLCVS